LVAGPSVVVAVPSVAFAVTVSAAVIAARAVLACLASFAAFAFAVAFVSAVTGTTTLSTFVNVPAVVPESAHASVETVAEPAVGI
jgi:hypothetical protein